MHTRIAIRNERITLQRLLRLIVVSAALLTPLAITGCQFLAGACAVADESNDGDSDGLDDFEEVNTYGTDPDLADSDGDGWTDGEEILFYLTDPLTPDLQ